MSCHAPPNADAISSASALVPSFMPCHVSETKSFALPKPVPMVSPAEAAASEQADTKPESALTALPISPAKKSVTESHAELISSASAEKPSAMPRPQSMKKSAISSARAFAPSQTSSQFLYSIHAAVTSSPMARTTGFASTESDRAFHAFRTILITPQTARMPTKAAVSLPIVLSRSTPEVLSQFMAFVSVSVSPFAKPSHFQNASNSLLPPLR